MAQGGIELDTIGTFGELLKHLRQRARLTQDEFGLAVGYSRAHVARLESNINGARRARVCAKAWRKRTCDARPACSARPRLSTSPYIRGSCPGISAKCATTSRRSARLDEATLIAAWAEGRALTYQQAMAYALAGLS
jgi:hypothetical protein